MTESQLVSALVDSRAPRPDGLTRVVAARLFPTWQALLVGAPAVVILGGVLGCVTAIALAQFGLASELAVLPGVALGIWIVVRSMRRRRAAFALLAREGSIVPAYDMAPSDLAQTLHAVEGALGTTLNQAFGGPIAAAEFDGTVVEARTVADLRGRFRVPELMLVDAAGDYVALLHRIGWITPQRVLRRRALKASMA